ncbi:MULTISPECIES: DUF1127 domain-containing protein [unclassified Inquilinus]|uniref:DUF1127 domain-containing protein n=1 Tax=unclassified Inquilinus TaxID=2645927 RepID=UPI003F90CDE7
MSYHSVQTTHRVHRTSSPAPRSRPYFGRLGAAVAAMARSIAEHRRLRRDERRLLEMTDHQLQDIGLRRVGHSFGAQIIEADDSAVTDAAVQAGP